MKILRIDPRPEDGKRLRGFADLELEGRIFIKGFRILQEPGRRPSVASPMASVKMPGKPAFLKSIVILPDEIKGQINLLVLTAWNALIRKKEKTENAITTPAQ